LISSSEDIIVWQIVPSEPSNPARALDEIPLKPTPVGETKYFRVRHLGDFTQACIVNLKRILFAKELLRLADHHQVGEYINDSDVAKYLGEFPHCPGGGVYTFMPFTSPPLCSLGGASYYGHRLHSSLE
jgi:hypothetical protein